MVNKNILRARLIDFFVVTFSFDLTSKIPKIEIQNFKAIRLSQLSNQTGARD